MRKAIILILLLSSCMNPSDMKNNLNVVDKMRKSIDKKYESVQTISADNLIELAQRKDFTSIIVDCRSKAEMEVSTIGNSAPKEGFEKFKGQFKDKTIYTFSTIGERSAIYAMQLSKEGFKVKNLSGGIISWIHAGGKISNQSTKDVIKKLKIKENIRDLLPEGYQGLLP